VSALIRFRYPAVILAMVFMLVLLATAVYPEPRIEFEETEFDWGEVNEGQNVTHDFRFKNAGDRILEIEKVRSS
jgi:hypothetical protein